jgi:hypothetical protein
VTEAHLPEKIDFPHAPKQREAPVTRRDGVRGGVTRRDGVRGWGWVSGWGGVRGGVIISLSQPSESCITERRFCKLNLDAHDPLPRLPPSQQRRGVKSYVPAVTELALVQVLLTGLSAEGRPRLSSWLSAEYSSWLSAEYA